MSKTREAVGSFEDALVMAYGDGSLGDEDFLFLHDYCEPVNPFYPQTGILIHFVWIRLIRASAKTTLAWPKTIFRFH